MNILEEIASLLKPRGISIPAKGDSANYSFPAKRESWLDHPTDADCEWEPEIDVWSDDGEIGAAIVFTPEVKGTSFREPYLCLLMEEDGSFRELLVALRYLDWLYPGKVDGAVVDEEANAYAVPEGKAVEVFRAALSKIEGNAAIWNLVEDE